MATIHPLTYIGAVSLNVADPERVTAFYQKAIGMELLQQEGDELTLGTKGGKTLVVLKHLPGAKRKPDACGLYHLALLLPSEIELGRCVKRIQKAGYRFEGFADHGVSEAVYLHDPEGNGLEIYCDRPRAEWPRDNTGQLRMNTNAIDLDCLLTMPEVADHVDSGLPSLARIGHVHLHVNDLPKGEAFYCRVLGFSVTQRYNNTACFVSAGGYHHHVGLNTWLGKGAAPADPASTGLRWYEVLLPDGEALADVRDRLAEANVPAEEADGGLLVHDPAGNGVLLK